MNETNSDDKGKLFERGGRKAFGTKLRDMEYVGRAAVLKLRGLPFWHFRRNMKLDAIEAATKLRRIGKMKISGVESGKATSIQSVTEAKILPMDRPKGLVTTRQATSVALSPLEQGMAVAEIALKDVPDTRDAIVNELKERISKGDYKVSGDEIAEMMLRRRAADNIR